VKRLQPNHAVFLENVGNQLRSAFSKRNIESIPVLGVISFPNINGTYIAISTGKPFAGLSVIFSLLHTEILELCEYKKVQAAEVPDVSWIRSLNKNHNIISEGENFIMPLIRGIDDYI
jgi:hypothetical protein